MARGFSKAIITGNITRDPETRSTPSGATVTSFSVAVNRSFRDSSGEQKESVSFIDCSAWGKAGEIIAQYAKKGSGILVSGRLDQRSWEDKDSGAKRSRVEIVVEDFNFLGAGTAGSSNTSAPAEAGDSSYSAPVDNAPTADDIKDDPIDLSEIPF